MSQRSAQPTTVRSRRRTPGIPQGRQGQPRVGPPAQAPRLERQSPRSAPRPAARRPGTGGAARRGRGHRARRPRPGRPDRRVGAALLVVLFVLSLFVGRLLQLQGLDASAMAEAALNERTRDEVVYAHRGDIVDDAGVVLATTVERRDVVIDQRNIAEWSPKDKHGRRLPGGPAGAAAQLAPVLGMDVATLTARLTGDRRFVYLVKGVTPELWRKVAERRIEGVISRQASQRVYPAGPVAANLLGFVGSDPSKPVKTGLELSLDRMLSGRDGTLSYERGATGQMIPTGQRHEIPPVDGRTLHLTIDRDLQWRAQAAIAAKVAQSGAESGDVVAMDARSGDLLAVASAPTFDPAHPGAASLADRGNRALSDVFEPGSTAKVITAAAAVEEGVANPASRFEVPDSIARADRTFHDSHPHGPEKLTLAGILAQSSNVGAIMVGDRMSNNDLHRYQRAFGLGARTGLGFPGESPGILAPASRWNASQRYTVMFGQGLSLNAVQATSVFQALANDGMRVPPRLVAGWTLADGEYRQAPASTGTRAVSRRTATQMRAMLQSVVGDEGTAKAAEISGYLVAGKTGTAQRYDSRCRGYCGYTASFIGMAPADDPRLVVGVFLQNPVRGHFGGALAGPVFADVMTAALQQRGVPATGGTPAVLPLTWQ